MYWAEDRIGAGRVKGAYAWRSLLQHGSSVAGGSDFPIESPNPLWGFYAAITRQDHSGWPDGGWYPEQRLTREEALKLFTTWASFAAFEEHTKGSLEAGKVADIVVLSDDIMKIEPRKILQTAVELTFVGGQVVYSSGVLVASGVP
jgi:predicted amidohydrolase YtcJ